MPTFTTRRLTGDDLALFRAVRSEGLTNDDASFRISVADDDALGDAHWKQTLERNYVIAVEGDGDVLAVGGFSRLSGTKADHKGLIWGMYVRPAARGKGVGDVLMNALVEHAKTLVRQVQLTVVAANPRAVAFYQRHGFRTYGVEPEAIRLEGSYADEALMWRLL